MKFAKYYKKHKKALIRSWRKRYNAYCHKTPWTSEDRKLIKELYKVYTDKELAFLLERTYTAVRSERQKLGLLKIARK